MKFELSQHAEEELARRPIPRDLLDEVLHSPQQVVPAHGGRSAYQSQVDLGGETYLILS